MPVLGPLVAYVQTPRSASGRLLEEPLEQLVHSMISAGVDAIAVLGSVGGAAYMPRSMRKKVITKVVELAAGEVPVLAGVGALTTAEVGLNLAEAADAGAYGAVLQPMSYSPLLPHEVTYLYEQANAVTKIPLWIYNNPATTRHTFSLSELANLASFENVMGFKDRAANEAEIRHRIEYVAQRLEPSKAEAFNWGFSGETKGALVLGTGGHSWHSALAGVMPSLCVELAQAAVAGRDDTETAVFAQQMQRALNPLTVTMTQYGGIRVAHAVAQLRGLDVGELPQPLRPLPPAVYGIVQLALQSIENSLKALHDEITKDELVAAAKAPIREGVPHFEPALVSRAAAGQSQPDLGATGHSAPTNTESAIHGAEHADHREIDPASAVHFVATEEADKTALTQESREGNGESVHGSPSQIDSRWFDALEGATRAQRRAVRHASVWTGEPSHVSPHTELTEHDAPRPETCALSTVHQDADLLTPESAEQQQWIENRSVRSHVTSSHGGNEHTLGNHLQGNHAAETLATQSSENPVPLPPARVSVKEKLANSATDQDAAHPISNILLTGDPALDQTRVNLERVELPIIREASRDAHNYIPHRARTE